MAAIDPDSAAAPLGLFDRLHRRAMKLVSSPGFQSWAAQFPLTRSMAKRDGEQLFDIASGFAYSQTLLAAVELGLFEALESEPKSPAQLAPLLSLELSRCEALCQAAASLKLITRKRSGSYQLARLGAATLGVPGLPEMIRHHAVFYRDLTDPVALLRGETDPELARFWPYVSGTAEGTIPADVAATYSELMAQSQNLVAEETLRTLRLSGINRLMDVGGGTGTFLKAVRAKYPDLALDVFDLAAVLEGADLSAYQISLVPGSFHDPLPRGADAISLIRVLFDHSDETIRALLTNIHETLPAGGRLIISEPMSGGATPNRFGDVYFSLYTMAMKTGKVRSGDAIGHLLSEIGFTNIAIHKTSRPFVTTCVSATRP